MRFPESLRWTRSAGGRESGGLVPTAKSVSRTKEREREEEREREQGCSDFEPSPEATGVRFSRKDAHGSEADRENRVPIMAGKRPSTTCRKTRVEWMRCGNELKLAHLLLSSSTANVKRLHVPCLLYTSPSP